jgi:hypothetical protein
MSGQKIIDGLSDAVAGNLSRVTIGGQVWVREPVLSELDIAALALEIETHKLSRWIFGGKKKPNCPICRDRARAMLAALREHQSLTSTK